GRFETLITVKNTSFLRGSKIGLGFNNLFDNHNIVAISPATPGNGSRTLHARDWRPSDASPRTERNGLVDIRLRAETITMHARPNRRPPVQQDDSDFVYRPQQRRRHVRLCVRFGAGLDLKYDKFYI